MDETFIVVMRGNKPAPIAVLSRAIAKATGQVALDVTRTLRDQTGIVARELTEEQAHAVVNALSNQGIRSFALAESQRVVFPEPVFLETARLQEEALQVDDLRDENHRKIGKVSVPCRDIVFLATAMVKVEVITREVVTDVSHTGAGPLAMPLPGRGAGHLLGAAIGQAINEASNPTRVIRRKTQSHYQHFLDLFAVEPAHHIRLDANTFNFYQTGLKMQPTSVMNLCRFIQALAPRCTEAQIDPSIRYILDGNPLTNLRCNSPAQYDAYLDWRIQLLYHPE
jgi:hypothetical protein